MWKWLRSRFSWRFSLGELVVAVVLLGALVGLNMWKIGPMHRRGPEPGLRLNLQQSTNDGFQITHVEWIEGSYGWPFVACEEMWDDRLWENPSASPVKTRRWNWVGLGGNILVGLAIICCGAAAWEFFVLRRSKKTMT